MKSIITIAAFGFDVREQTNERGASFVRAFKKCGYSITHVSTDFDHSQKAYVGLPLVENVEGVHVKRLHVLAYKKNLSIRRILSHLQFAWKLRKYLNSLEEKPNYIYCVTPTSTSAYVTGKYCKKHGVKFILDLIDIWPDSLIPLYSSKLITIATSPWSYITHKAYKMADFICGESVKYANHAHQFNHDVPWFPIYLGVNKEKVNRLISESKVVIAEKKVPIRLCYGGDLGNSYGFDAILKALDYIQTKGVHYEMYFVGGGDRQQYIQEYSTGHDLNVIITGKLPYCDYLKYLSTCDVAFNAFGPNTKVVHSYKFNDYIATGNFVLSNLKGETADMVDKYHIGKNYEDDNLGEILLDVCQNWTAYSTWRNNIDGFVHEVLDADIIYTKVVKEIEKK